MKSSNGPSYPQARIDAFAKSSTLPEFPHCVTNRKKGAQMSTTTMLAMPQPDPAKFFAEICAAYVEVLAGARRPEQLARWLSDRAYYDVCQRARREARARELTGVRVRPEISLRATKTFLTDFTSYQGVVLLQISGKLKAISVRAELIHERYRITDLCLI